MRNQKLSNGLTGLSRKVLCGIMIGAIMIGGVSLPGHAGNYVRHIGVVKEVGEDYLMVNTDSGLIKFLVNRKTKKVDENGKEAMDFKVSDLVKVKSDSAMTKSAIPQTNAVKIKRMDKLRTAEIIVKDKQPKMKKEKKSKMQKEKKSKVKFNELNDLTDILNTTTPTKPQLTLRFF